MIITFNFINQLRIILFLSIKFKLGLLIKLEFMKKFCIVFRFYLHPLIIFNQDKSSIFLTIWELLEECSKFWNNFFQYFYLKLQAIVSFYKRSPVFIYCKGWNQNYPKILRRRSSFMVKYYSGLAFSKLLFDLL